MTAISARDQTATASLALVLGGAMWGVYWIPVRFFVDQGLTGPWPGMVMYTAALAVLSPLLWRIRQHLFSKWRDLLLSGVLTGAAFSLFTISLVYTDVARAILLFYLTPLWGTLLGLLFLGERLHRNRVLGLLCGITGLIIVLGDEQWIPWPQNVGDWLALVSGMAWALGSMGLYRSKNAPISGQVFAFVSGALLLSLLSLVFHTPIDTLHFSDTDTIRYILLFALLSALYTLPMMYLTIWPATVLSPARVGLLLMSEVVVGLASAAVFSGEPFGLRELTGAVLIVSAALFEIVKA